MAKTREAKKGISLRNLGKKLCRQIEANQQKCKRDNLYMKQHVAISFFHINIDFPHLKYTLPS